MDINQLNSSILKITLFIKSHHPELAKFLDEMPVSIPDEKDPQITIKSLQAYKASLISFMEKYEMEMS